MTVLVTGASGRLGRLLVPRLRAAGHEVRAAGRSGPVELDLATGEGLAAAVSGADAVLHLASSASNDPLGVDVEGTRRLVRACAEHGVGHLVYPSIVGIHLVPTAYYRAKLEAERVIEHGGVPFTTIRITQFHVFARELAEARLRWPVVVVPRGAVLQPIDEGEAADALLACLATGPSGRVPDLGGPEVLPFAELVRTVAGDRTRCWWERGIPSVGIVGPLRAGALCLEPGQGRTSTIRFAEWWSTHRA